MRFCRTRLKKKTKIESSLRFLDSRCSIGRSVGNFERNDPSRRAEETREILVFFQSNGEDRRISPPHRANSHRVRDSSPDEERNFRQPTKWRANIEDEEETTGGLISERTLRPVWCNAMETENWRSSLFAPMTEKTWNETSVRLWHLSGQWFAWRRVSSSSSLILIFSNGISHWFAIQVDRISPPPQSFTGSIRRCASENDDQRQEKVSLLTFAFLFCIKRVRTSRNCP